MEEEGAKVSQQARERAGDPFPAGKLMAVNPLLRNLGYADREWTPEELEKMEKMKQQAQESRSRQHCLLLLMSLQSTLYSNTNSYGGSPFDVEDLRQEIEIFLADKFREYLPHGGKEA